VDGSVEVVASDNGKGLKKLSSSVHFWNSFPLSSTHVDHNMWQFLHFYSVEQD
jgi:hypothetical protein